MVERIDSGKLFQREGAQELNDPFPALVLTLGTNKVIPLFDLNAREWKWSSKQGVQINGLFFTDLEIKSTS